MNDSKSSRKLEGTATYLLVALLLCSSIMISVSSATSISEEPWWNGSWQYRRKIDITENTGNNATGYPIVVNLNQTHLQHILPSGADIRFITGGSELEYAIKDWNYPNSATIWVKLNLTAYETSEIYIYYGNEFASDRQSSMETTITGSTSYDSSSHKNNGTIYGATPTVGAYSGGLSFDGQNDYVEVASSSSLDLTTGMSLEAWLKPKNVTGWQDIISKWNMPENRGYMIQIFDGRLRAAVSMNGSWNPDNIVEVSAIHVNEWIHAVATYSGNEMRLYINGELKKQRTIGAGTIHSQMYPLKIGCLGSSFTDNFFEGILDEIKIFNRALNQIEVDYSYRHLTPLNSTGLVLWHRFDSEPMHLAEVTIGMEKQMSSITLLISNTTIRPEDTVTVSGFITSPRPGVTVTLLLSTDNSTFVKLDDVVTNSLGNFSYSFSPTTSGTFYLKASWLGDESHGGAESNVQSLFALEPSQISCSVSSGRIVQGEEITVSGFITSPRPGVTVTLLYENLRIDGLIREWRHLYTMSNGSFSDVYTPKTTGSWRVTASWEGDATTSEAKSLPASFTVYMKPSQGSSVYSILLTATIIGLTVIAFFVWRSKRGKRMRVFLARLANFLDIFLG